MKIYLVYLTKSKDLCEYCEATDGIHPPEHLFLKLRQNVVANKETGKPKADSPQLDAQIVAETMTVPSSVQSGSSLTKLCKFKNTGSLVWPRGTRLIRESGDFFGLNSLEVPAVQPNAEVELIMGLRAPTEPGRYLSHWTLVSPANEKFGPMVWVDVMVDAKANTTKEPQPENTNIPTALKQLQDMGFADSQKNLSLLSKHNGNVLQVVHELLTLEISK
jgi:hypothetical protein